MRVSVRLQPCKRPVKFSAIAPRPVDIFELPPPAGDFELYNVISARSAQAVQFSFSP
jgi:hypothetical protein